MLFRAETWVMTPCIGRFLGGVPTQGHVTGHGEADPAAIGWYLGITSAGDGGTGIRV